MLVEQNLPFIIASVLAGVLVTLAIVVFMYVVTKDAATVAFTAFKLSEQLVDAGQERLKGVDKAAIATFVSTTLLRKYPILSLFITPQLVQTQIELILAEADIIIDKGQVQLEEYLKELFK